VFVGGWSLEAVETACADDGLPREAILNLLGQLVDKSLVQTEFEPDGSVRYRLLETLRVFGWEHLQNRGEVDELRCRHLDLFVRLAEQGGVALQGQQQVAWLQRLETEHENLRAALRWAEERPNPMAGLRIAGALGRFWSLHGHLGEGRRWTDLFLQQTLGPTWTHVATLRANALLAASSLAFKQGDFKAVQNLAEEGCSQSRAVRDEGATATWLVLLGHVARVRGELDRAVALFEQALAFERRSGNGWGLAGALQALGLAVGARGEEERATALHAESLALYRAVGDQYGSGSELFWLGQHASGRGDVAGANRLFEQSLTELRTLHDQRNIAFVLHAQGALARKNGQYARAETLHAEGLAQSQQCADMEGVRVGLQACAQLAATRALPKRAARLFGTAEALSESLGVLPSPTERSEHEQLVRAARRRLDAATFAATWAEGRALPIEHAVAYALAGGGPGADRGVWGQPTRNSSGPTLTSREWQVALLVGRGLTNRQIATQLVFTESTAAKHIEHILDKLGVNSRVQISAWATELRLSEARSD
jgi:DNA-binding CsgD family transcriptional regulator